MKTRKELESMKEVGTKFLRNYVDLPKGWVVVEETEFNRSTAWNPTTGDVREYRYGESPCYVDSASVPSYNGDYQMSHSYKV